MKRILVIDDDQNLLMMMVEMLQVLGFETISAEGGTRGLEIAGEEKPGLILCDLNMPGVDGFETLKTLRATEPISGTPFVLLSGCADNATRQKAEKLGANGVIGKPFATSELLAVLNFQLKAAA